jgi:tetratricopeptide (TPR) repeat protein
MIIPSPELSVIDSLMWRQADSALMRLIPWFDTCKDAAHHNATDETFDRHYANLLLSELLYKNDYPQTNRPELQQAVPYFDSLMQVPEPVEGLSIKLISFLAARAHYINGVGYYEQDSVVQACKQYLKALEVMENHFEEKKLVGKKANFMAMTYTRLTELFSDLYLNQQAIYFGMHSLPYYETSETSPWHLPWMLSEIGALYNLIKELDSADYYFQQAKTRLPDTVSQMYRDIISQQALLSYYKIGQSEKAITDLRRMAVLASSENERLARSLSIGDIYYCEQQFDSAKVYFEHVYESTKNPDGKMLATDRLWEISLAEGDTLKANGYALARSQFATEKDKEGNLNSDLTTLCQQYEQDRREAQHKLKTQKATKRWCIALGLAAFVVVMASLLLVVLQRRMQSQQYSHLMEQAALSGRLKKSNEALREMKSQIKRLGNTQKPDEAASFVEEPICRLIMERVKDGQFLSQMDCRIYKDYALSKEDVAALREAADRHFHHFTSRLAKAYPELTKVDLDYCCLYLLGLTDADIAALMQRAYNTVNERSGKLKRIFGCNNGVSATLHAIANDKASI